MQTKIIRETKEEITQPAILGMEPIPAGTLVMSFKLSLGRLGFAATAMYSNEAICALRSPKADPEFLYHQLGRTDLSKYGKQAVKGHTLNRESLRDVLVLLPPRDEQHAIAEVLRDADELVEALTKLIAKKHDVKQAVAHELFSQRTRLSGSSRAWEERQLGTLGRWIGGGTPSMAVEAFWKAGTIPWASSGDIRTIELTSTSYRITEMGLRTSSAKLVPAGSILFVTRSGILRRHLPVAKTVVPVAINQDIKAAIPNHDVDPDFLLQALLWHGPSILATCLKAGTTVESVEYRWLKAFSIALPPLDEQRAISRILVDMDREIDTLKRQLAKSRALKEAMAQQLLSGRVRLSAASRAPAEGGSEAAIDASLEAVAAA